MVQLLIGLLVCALFSMVFIPRKKKMPTSVIEAKKTIQPEQHVPEGECFSNPFYSPLRKKLKYYQPTKKNPNRR